MSQNSIRVVGAREHNLKNITVEIPRDKFVVITGLSGSGKSSLAFDTIFAEGQRRYVESLSAYARQFLGQMEKPDVDYIEGLSPAVSIDQKGASHNPRSTVGTVTEIYDYLRLLFARAGIPHCPQCGRDVSKQSAQEIVDEIERLPDDSRLFLLAPVIRGRKGTHQAVIEEIRKAGFVRVRVDGVVHELDEGEIQMDRYKIHTIEAVVDRVVIRKHQAADEAQAFRSRLTDSVETALKFGEGYLTVQIASSKSQVAGSRSKVASSKVQAEEGMPQEEGDLPHANMPPATSDLHFSEHLACPVHGSVLPEIEPRTFSFNTPHGACPDCQGLGGKLEIDPDLLIPDPDVSLNDGAITVAEWGGPKEEGGYYWQLLEAVAQEYEIDLNAPVRDMTPEQRDIVLYGTHGQEVTLHYRNKDGRQATWRTAFEGVINNLQRRYNETSSEYMRERISLFMNERICPTCQGKRLRKEALAITVDEANIVEVTEWPVNRTLEWVKKLYGAETPLTARQQAIAERILKEIHSRLGFLVDVGLD